MKLTKIYFVLFLLLSSSLYFGQTLFLGHKLSLTPKQKPPGNFDQIVYRSQILKKYTSYIKDQAELTEFSDFLVTWKKFYLSSNTEYEKEDSAIAYLKKICEKINPYIQIPINLRITRDPSLNACAFEDGTIYVNIGLLAKYDTEAEIAAVLGHEIGHVIKMHHYKSYDIYKDIYRAAYNSPYQNKSFLGTLISVKRSFNKFVAQEEESDELAIELLIKSNYSTKALFTVEDKFLALEEKHKASSEYRKSGLSGYFHTHPATESRLKKAKKVPDNFGKNFLVDSVYFQRLKHWAIDETIHLEFEENNFLLSVELAFNEHLKYPEDPFYLFYLTEGTRRALAYFNMDGINFISGLYKDNFSPIALGNDSVYVQNDSIHKKIKRAKANSILLKLAGPILSYRGAEFKDYKSVDLLNEDSLEFLNYTDALVYFKKVNAKLGFRLNNHFLDKACDLTNLTDQEKAFQLMKCDSTQLLPKVTATKKTLFVLFHVEHMISQKNMKAFDNSSSFKFNHNRRSLILEKTEEIDQGTLLSFGNEMSFDDQNKMINYLGLFSAMIRNKEEKQLTTKNSMRMLRGENPDFMITQDSATINAQSICPELIPILNKYQFTGIVFSAIDVSEETVQGMYGTGGHTEKWKIKHYYYDVKTNKIKFYLSPNCISSRSNVTLFSQQNMYSNVDLNNCFYQTIKDVVK